MDIRIAPNLTIASFQEQFQKRFPFLKLEFFKVKSGATIRPENKIEATRCFGDLDSGSAVGQIHLTGLTTVRELEEQIRQQFGIHAEIFRKSGKVWLRTTTTDNWTLDEQNAEARDSGEREQESGERPDYHEQE